MKKIFIVLLASCSWVACNHSEEAIETYQQQKEAMGLLTIEKQNELLGQEPIAFSQNIQAITDQYAVMLSENKELPVDFVAKEEKVNRYKILSVVSAYLLNHRKYTEEDAPAIKNLEGMFVSVDMDNETDFAENTDYQTTVINRFQQKIRNYRVEYEFDDHWGKILADFNTLKSENIKDKLASLFIEGVSATSEETTNRQIIELVQQRIKDKELLQALNERIVLVDKLKAGQPFPPFAGLTDLNDKEAPFESLPLKEKLLFVDIWATYCPDCRKELPALEALQEVYKRQPITFVSISVDSDKEAWKTMVKNDKLRGIHLFASAEINATFKKLYDLRSIPRYMLIDAEGNFINSNAPMPSDEELKRIIDAQLLQLTASSIH